ncbi:Maf family protein, partial [Lutibacter sp.]
MIFDKFKNKHIILASASPRRQELFKNLGINFTIKIKEIEEN